MRWLRCWHAVYTCTGSVWASVDDPWRAGVGSEWGVSSGDTRGVACGGTVVVSESRAEMLNWVFGHPNLYL